MRLLDDRRIGVQPQFRKKIEVDNANQWVQSPKQQKFIELWLSPSSKTFSNAFKSALSAGYSESYSRKITASYTGLEWVSDYKRSLSKLQPDDIVLELQLLALSARQDRDRLTALDKLARIQGMYLRNTNTTNLTFVNTVPRPKMDE